MIHKKKTLESGVNLIEFANVQMKAIASDCDEGLARMSHNNINNGNNHGNVSKCQWNIW